ncbi:hypothetical protein ACHHYP_11774 [Achlya hypogyna]|uniref:Disintegrin domain-containing protein n=1 Tax=Achlya hypogyna TaxID=1202772 RepID=A0A1V9YIE5_ACHHY|nr:hypothetical protein ACHHYP_11774 [Achlya hypogyna]
MKFIAYLVIAVAGVLALEEVISAGAPVPTCTANADCPPVPCHSAPICSSGHCQYTKLAVGTLCPSQGCSNGGICDDDANDQCDAAGTCQDAYLPALSTCNTGNPPCVLQATCSGTSGTCPTPANAPSGTPCTGNDNIGDCVAADTCDGSGNCVDNYAPSTTQCAAGSPPCVLPAMCTGTAGTCPTPANAVAGTACSGGSNSGACDGQDICNGFGICTDVYLDATVLCNKGATLCDANTFCDGTASACPTIPGELVYLDEGNVSMATYLSDTVAQCSAKAVSVGSSQLMAMYSSTPSSLMVVAAAVGAVAVVASALVAKKAERFVSMEDGYAHLAEDVN